ncbi:MAG: T9SS type A sorting domain-containing protein [candidate division WOR-3 bacterium]|nr:T9SS type A sorting domain-containing protein [candidate division WOR-3 bacterium]
MESMLSLIGIIVCSVLAFAGNSSPVLNTTADIPQITDTQIEIREKLIEPPLTLAIPYSIEWRISLPDTYHVGLTPVGDTLLWVSEGGFSSADPAEIYVYNLRTLALVDSFNQPGVPVNNWGWRDMTSRGDTVFASYDANIRVIHWPTRTVVRSFAPGTGLNPHRALAWNPGDSLYSANFASAIWQFYKTTPYGARSVANIDTSYGLSYDANGFVWMSVQTGANQGKIAKFSYPGLVKLDQQNIPEITGIAGGCEMWRDTFLLYLNQGTPDEVVCIRLYFPPNDVGVVAIRAPARAVNPGSAIAPVARIRNFSPTPISNIPVHCWIDSAGVRIYNQTLTYPGPVPGSDTALVTFTPNWTVGPVGVTYQIKMFTNLANDGNRANDTTSQATVSFNIKDTLTVPWRQVTPTIDGNIQPPEWADALVWDISDVLGQNGVPRPPGSAIFYCKHDSQYVYYAVAMPPASAKTDNDQIGIYVDENYDRAWAGDSSEGNHWFAVVNNVDSTIYRALLSGWIRWASGNGFCRSSTVSGHMQFEAWVQKGGLKWNYTISPSADTVAFYIYALDQPGDVYYGMWPTTMPAAQWNNPQYYGTLILSPYVVSVEEVKSSVLNELKIPNPFRAPLILEKVSKLEVYDVLGKRVNMIENTKKGKLTWNGRDRNGETLPAGVYFLKIETEQGTVTKKAVLLR